MDISLHYLDPSDREPCFEAIHMYPYVLIKETQGNMSSHPANFKINSDQAVVARSFRGYIYIVTWSSTPAY